MHVLFKIIWLMQTFFLKPFFGKLKLPSYIGRPIFLLGTNKMFIEERVRIFPGLRAECHDKGRLFIHENVTVGQNFHVTCMRDLHIRSGTIMSGDVMITDIDHEYKDPAKSVIDQPYIYSRTDIGENCFLGFGVRIQAGTTLGKGCIVGANSVVRGDFPDHCVIVGAPARVVKRYDQASGQWQRC